MRLVPARAGGGERVPWTPRARLLAPRGVPLPVSPRLKRTDALRDPPAGRSLPLAGGPRRAAAVSRPPRPEGARGRARRPPRGPPAALRQRPGAGARLGRRLPPPRRAAPVWVSPPPPPP